MHYNQPTQRFIIRMHQKQEQITSSGPAVKKYIRLIAANPVFTILGIALNKTNMK
jgi:hypothetical protein